MKLFRKEKKQAGGQVFENLPRHIAIIMDGNGRWAQKRALARNSGHPIGAENFRTIATYCKDIGVDYLTVYAFSTENWKRPPQEVGTIMALMEKYLQESIDTMEQKKIRLRIFGDVSGLSPALQEKISRTNEISTHYSGFQANVCINYGGRSEIIRAAKQWAAEGGGELTEEIFSGYMYSAGIPDPDLVIRTGGEMRISNFLLWQSAYSEFYFTDVLWPDFSTAELDKAIDSYQKRSRRFGGV